MACEMCGTSRAASEKKTEQPTHVKPPVAGVPPEVVLLQSMRDAAAARQAAKAAAQVDSKRDVKDKTAAAATPKADADTYSEPTTLAELEGKTELTWEDQIIAEHEFEPLDENEFLAAAEQESDRDAAWSNFERDEDSELTDDPAVLARVEASEQSAEKKRRRSKKRNSA